jgi:hypothetical protein
MVYRHVGKEPLAVILLLALRQSFAIPRWSLHPLRLHKFLTQSRVASFALVNDFTIVTIVSSTKQLCTVQATAQGDFDVLF